MFQSEPSGHQEMKASHKEGHGLQEDIGLVVHLSFLSPVQLGGMEGGWTNCTHQPRYCANVRGGGGGVVRQPRRSGGFAAGLLQACCGFAAELVVVMHLCIAISSWNRCFIADLTPPNSAQQRQAGGGRGVCSGQQRPRPSLERVAVTSRSARLDI